MRHAATAAVVVGLRAPTEVAAAQQRYGAVVDDAVWDAVENAGAPVDAEG